MNYIGKSTTVPSYPIGTSAPHFQSSPGVWNLNEVYNRMNGVGSGAGQRFSMWPQSPTRTLTYRTNTTGSGTTTALTLTHPVGVVAGDLCVLFHAAYDTDADVIMTAPTNFIGMQPFLGYLVSGSTNYISQYISYIILTSTANVTLPLAYDRGGSVTTSAPTNQAFIALYFYLDETIGHVRKIPFYEFPTNSSTNPASKTNNAGSYTQACPLLALGSVISNSETNLGLTASDPDFDLVVTNTAATNIEMAVGYKIYNSAPSNITVDTDSTATYQSLQTILLSIRSQ